MKDRNWRDGEPGLVCNAWAFRWFKSSWLARALKWSQLPPVQREPRETLRPVNNVRPVEPWEGERKRRVLGVSTLTLPPRWNMGSALWCTFVWTWVSNGQGCVYLSHCAFVPRFCEFVFATLGVTVHSYYGIAVNWEKKTHLTNIYTSCTFCVLSRCYEVTTVNWLEEHFDFYHKNFYIESSQLCNSFYQCFLTIICN